MGILERKIVWRKPISNEKTPLIGRLHSAAYAPASSLLQKALKKPMPAVFKAAYKLGVGGRGALRLRVKGEEKVLGYDGRNLQFSGLYMPQHARGYEPETAALLDALVGPKDVFYDVGSNWGCFALSLAARADFSGKVFAFEPAPDSFRDLADLVEKAGLESLIDCKNFGLSDRNGDGGMTVPDGLHSGLATVSAAGGTPVALRRLDDLDLPPPHVVKMDVEDHEVEALAGGEKVLAKAGPYVVFESSLERRPETKLAPFELLARLGYEFYRPAWRVGDGADARREASFAPDDGAPAILALVPFAPAERARLASQFNVLASHRERRGELQARFENSAA